MEIITNSEFLKRELFDVMHLFYNNCELDNTLPKLTHTHTLSDKEVIDLFILEDNEITELENRSVIDCSFDEMQKKRFIKHFAKLGLYKLLSKKFNKIFPWGSLTGIRPTRVAYELLNTGTPNYLIKETLMEKYLVSEQKAKLVEQVIRNQKCIISNDHLIDLYINIPFCPTKCSYCSFVSSQYSAVKDIIPQYLDALLKEIRATKQFINKKSFVVRTIYIGGGTPTVLNAEQLDMLLNELAYNVTEFTVECGRPDTITREKLEVLKNHNVTRISINPQTFVDATLKRIGRKHTVKDVLNAYKLALPFNFTINMDLIAGLPDESFRGFKKSIDTVIELAPDNITVHTLAIKNGAELSQDLINQNNEVVAKMINYANQQLTANEYKPYYLYKLKNQCSGQENVGYYKEKVCIFNIDSMEETCTVLACGANAITKRIYGFGGRIERFANVKEIKEYINRIDEMIEKKCALFENNGGQGKL